MEKFLLILRDPGPPPATATLCIMSIPTPPLIPFTKHPPPPIYGLRHCNYYIARIGGLKVLACFFLGKLIISLINLLVLPHG